MENASKALLIAGAVLLAILVVTLGIMIFSSNSKNISSNVDAQISEMELIKFNNQYKMYEGLQRRK